MLIPAHEPGGKYRVPLDAGQDTGRADTVGHADSVDKVGGDDVPNEKGAENEGSTAVDEDMSTVDDETGRSVV